MFNFPCSLQQHERVLSVYGRELPEKHPRRIRALGKKAGALRLLGRLDDSLSLYEAALKLGRLVFERDSEDLLVLEGDTAMTLSHLGKHEAAAEVYERVIKASERSPRFGPSHQTTWACSVSLGLALVELRGHPPPPRLPGRLRRHWARARESAAGSPSPSLRPGPAWGGARC